MKLRYFALLSISFTLLAAVLTSKDVSALSSSDWRAGSIIKDSLFTDGAGMSVAQIQNFLQTRLPYCDIHGTKTSELGGGSRAQYAASKANPAPFTCITNYYEVPKTSPGPNIPVNNYGLYNPDGSTHIPAGSKSAAQLIYDAAQKHSINPKALLIKLATESAGPLTSDEWPLKIQYYYAMGAHCPDSGPGGAANCDINYSGFSIQISESARLLRGYLDGMTQSWWPYKKPFQTNNILWNVVERGCGSAPVYIETKATAALYTYTPYQPNQAALNNLYGIGDSCSAYGNRNFWRVWNDWFGSTQEDGYTPFFQFSGSVTTYVMGANKTYYTISDYEKLKDYGFESSFGKRVKQIEKSSLSDYTHNGELPYVARFEGIGVFVVQRGEVKPFPSEETFNNYGYTFGQEATLPKEMLDVLPQGSPIWQVAMTSGGGATYHINSGKKQAMCNWDAFTKLGSPTYSSRPSVSLKSAYLSQIPDGAPIAMDGDLIGTNDGRRYGVYEQGSLYPMASDIAQSSGAINCAISPQSFDQTPKQASDIKNLVKNPDGSRYILDTRRRLQISEPLFARIGVADDNYAPLSKSFFDRIPSVSRINDVIRKQQDLGVYLIQNGKKYGIPTESDFYGLGYTFPQVTSVNQRTFDSIPSGGSIAKPGRLIRVGNDKGVYLLDTDFRMYGFPTEGIFFGYGYNWGDVMSVAPGYISEYKSAGAMSNIVRDFHGNILLIDNKKRHLVPSAIADTQKMSLDPSSLPWLSDPALSRLSAGAPATGVMRAQNDIGVYVIENGKKRVFASEAALFANGYNWGSVQVFSPSVVNSFPTGEPIYR